MQMYLLLTYKDSYKNLTVKSSQSGLGYVDISLSWDNPKPY